MRVLLLDQRWPSTLWFLPALRRAGASVVLAMEGRSDDRFIRRYCSVRSIPKVDDPELDDCLRTEVATGRYDAVLAMSDDLLKACWRALPEASVSLWPAVPPPFRVLLRDRVAIERWVSGLGVPVPHSEQVSGTVSGEALARMGRPWVVRGTQGFAGSQVRVAQDEAAARRALEEMRAMSLDPPYLQRFVQGPTVLIGGLFSHGECRQWFAAEKVEVYPEQTGPSIRLRSIAAEQEIRYADDIFRHIRFHGLGFVEFKRPPAGPPIFIELNPRPWGSIRAAARSGIDFLDLASRQICGREVPEGTPYRPGTETALFPQFIAARLKQRRLPLAPTEAGSWVRSLRAAPWSEPALLLRFARGLWWDLLGGR